MSSLLVLATYFWGKMDRYMSVGEWGEVKGRERERGRMPSQTQTAGCWDPHWLAPVLHLAQNEFKNVTVGRKP